jgi:hypothetical protein
MRSRERKLTKTSPWFHETHDYLTPEAIGAAIRSGSGDEAKSDVQQATLEALADGNCEDASLCAFMAAYGCTDHKWEDA